MEQFRATLATLFKLAVLAVAAAAATPEDATITNPRLTNLSTLPLDSDGRALHAHGAGILAHGGRYWLVGATQKLPPDWLSEGVNLYSSSDLQHWAFENTILRNSSITTRCANLGC